MKQVLVHVRISAPGVPIEELEPLRDAIRAVVGASADKWGVRIKRREMTPERFWKLFAQYEKRLSKDA